MVLYLFPVVRGKIQLKPFFGDSIATDLVPLTMSLPDKDAINVWCAVVDNMSDDSSTHHPVKTFCCNDKEC